MQTVGELIDELIGFDRNTEVSVVCSCCGRGSTGTVSVQEGINGITLRINQEVHHENHLWRL